MFDGVPPAGSQQRESHGEHTRSQRQGARAEIERWKEGDVLSPGNEQRQRGERDLLDNDREE